ncbi:hypothetical protein E8E14_006218 [Neopestalotiopsis sp. 37M]|nr:hypothetical protein E8E14_006218 [Neopestalotiopsis sp. 37M]
MASVVTSDHGITLPHFSPTKTSRQLIVDGKPYLILGAELHNSTWSNAEYMSSIWPHMKEMHINTLLGAVAWESIEPYEGTFDFIENEIGIMGDTRDHSVEAESLFKQMVPDHLLTHLRTNFGHLNPAFQRKFEMFGEDTRSSQLTWTEAFGDNVWADDLFMADAFSRFVQHVAAAGRAEYDLPTFVNVALCNEDASWADDIEIPAFIPAGDYPGQYPSGGPVGHNMDIYRFNAPAIECYSPDIYLQDYEKVSECFSCQGLPLFIPEQRRDAYGTRRMWSAIGSYQAIGCAPFGIDSIDPNDCDLAAHYKLLSAISPQILDAQAHRPEDIVGFFFDEPNNQPSKKVTKVMGDFELTIERAFMFGKQGPGAGIVVRQADGTYLGAGFGFQVVFKSTNPRSTFSAVLRVEEKEVGPDGKLKTSRILNGDETNHGNFWIMPSVAPDLGIFPVPCFVPARTMIAQCTPYSIEENI